MKIDSVNALVQALGAARVLEPPQLDEVVRRMQPRFQDPRELARELLQRGWLTKYHVSQLLQGRPQNLVLGHFVLLERIGEGGMGQVFKARHQKLNRTVALKVIRKEYLANAEAVARFQREIKAAAQLHHPNIVHAFDADQVGQSYYIAMEFVEGVDLAKLLKESGPLPVPIACDYVRQAALGLQHAHEKGMVHRDIKPSNLLVTRVSSHGSDSGTKGRWGQVKILDMGVARTLKADVEDATLTQDGAVVGTPDYMAPEQARDSRAVDIRADLYSLGCTLYQLLAGQVPYPGGTGMEKVFKHQLEEPRPIDKLRTDLPRGLAKVLQTLMAKRPEDRYPIPGDAARALEPYTRPGNQPVQIPTALRALGPADSATPGSGTKLPQSQALRPTLPDQDEITPSHGFSTGLASRTISLAVGRRKLWLLASAAGILFVVLLAGLTVALWPRAKKSSTETVNHPPASESPLDRLDRSQIPAAERTSLPPEVVAVLGESKLRHWGSVTAVAYSPDGKRFASAGHDRCIRIWDASTGDQVGLVRIPNTPPPSALAFTPDGKEIISAAFNQGLRIWNIATGSSRPGPDVTGLHPRLLVLAADGRTALVVATKDTAAHIFDIATGQEKQVIPPPGPMWMSAAFSADGNLAALLTFNPGGGPGHVYLWDVKAGKERRRFQPGGMPHLVTVAPDGETVGLVSRNGMQLFQASKNQAVRSWPEGKGSHFLAFAPKGNLAVRADIDGLHLLDVSTGKERTILPKEFSRTTQAAFSPDGQTVILASYQPRLTVWDIAAGRERFPDTLPANPVATHLAFRADGAALLGTSSFPISDVMHWEIGKGPQRVPMAIEGTQSWLIGTTPAMETLLVRTQNTLVARDGATGREKGRFQLPGNQMLGMIFPSPDCSRVAISVPNGNEFHILEVPSLEKRATLTANKDQRSTLAFSGNGKTAVTCDASGRVKLWDTTTGAERSCRIPEQKNPVMRVAVNNDGRTVALVDGGQVVRLFDAAEGSERHSLAQSAPTGGHRLAYQSSLRFSPDDKVLLIWTSQGFQLWETATGKLRGKVEWGEFARMGPMEFSPDGSRLAQADLDGRVTLWDTADAKEVFFRKLPGSVTGLAFAQGHRYLATGNSNGTIFIFRLP